MSEPRQLIEAMGGRFLRSRVADPDGDVITSALGWCVGLFFSGRAICVLISARWLNAGTEAGVLFTFAVSAVLLVALLLQGFGPSANPVKWIWTASTFRWIAAYLAFSGCSLWWTQALSPASSGLYWCALVADVALVLLVFRGSGDAESGYTILKGFICGSCVLAAIAWLLPAAEDLRLGDLDYFNTNQIGNLCALSIFACSFLANRNQGRWRVASAVLLLTLIRSLSKSTLVAFIAAQIYRFLSDRSMGRRKKILLSVCAVGVVLAFWGLVEAYTAIYTTAGNQTETLTGRTAIWAWTLNAALNRPWFGNGIDAMWKVAPPFGGDLFEARHAENELLQQFFAYGMAGVIMLAGVYGAFWRSVQRMCAGSERSILTSLLIYVLVRGFAEAEPFDLLLPVWLITTLLGCMQKEKTLFLPSVLHSNPARSMG
jgi:O-antigen ligase